MILNFTLQFTFEYIMILFELNLYYYIIVTNKLLFIIVMNLLSAGCAPHRGGGAVQGRELGEDGEVHGGRAECTAV